FTPTSPTSTRSSVADTSPPGRSRSCFQTRFAQPLSQFANSEAGTADPAGAAWVRLCDPQEKLLPYTFRPGRCASKFPRPYPPAPAAFLTFVAVSFVFIESLSETVPSRRSPDSGFAFGLGRNLGTSAEPCAAYTCSLWNGGLCTKTRVCKLV